jgi:hypothetical protein
MPVFSWPKSAKQLYQEYIDFSPAWQRIKYTAHVRDHWRCVMCGARGPRVRLVGHHNEYPGVWGTEPLWFVASVCVPCHDWFHHQPEYREQLAEYRRIKAMTVKLVLLGCVVGFMAGAFICMR